MFRPLLVAIFRWFVIQKIRRQLLYVNGSVASVSLRRFLHILANKLRLQRDVNRVRDRPLRSGYMASGSTNQKCVCIATICSTVGEYVAYFVPRHSFPETPEPPQRNPHLAPQVALVGQRTQIGPRYVHSTYRNVPSCSHEHRATSLSGPCQIPRPPPGQKTHLAPPTNKTNSMV
jgi:hypothetical protein